MNEARVLIADDEESIRRVLAICLRAAGFASLEAADGEEALRIAQQGLADVMLLDLMMPGLTGMQVLHELRRAGNQLPVVVVTGSGGAATEEAGKHGVSSFVAKPFRGQEVVSAVWAALAGRGEGTSPAGASVTAPAAGSEGFRGPGDTLIR